MNQKKRGQTLSLFTVFRDMDYHPSNLLWCYLPKVYLIPTVILKFSGFSL